MPHADQSAMSGSRPGQLHIAHSGERALLGALGQNGHLPLRGQEILDVGCGRGDLLVDFVAAGADPQQLHGVDLSEDRIACAHRRLPTADVRCADARRLPYDDNSFDLVLQYTLLSSILDDTSRRRVADEIRRVVRQPGGLVVSYDFWWNPLNRDTRGLRLSEIKDLFPRCRYSCRSLTLAPPVVRRFASVSWIMCDLLEAMRLLNTHYLVTIHPPTRDHSRPDGRGPAVMTADE